MKAPTCLPGNMQTDFLPIIDVDGSTIQTVFDNAISKALGRTVFANCTGSAVKVLTKSDYQYALQGFCRGINSSPQYVDFTLFNANVGCMYFVRISQTSIATCKKVTGTSI